MMELFDCLRVRLDDDIDDADQVMSQYGVTSIEVVAGGRPVAVLTLKRVLEAQERRIATGGDRLTVADIVRA